MLAGDQLAISSHGSVLQVGSGFQRSTQEGAAAGFQLQQLLGLQELLPLRCLGYLSETRLVGAGFDGEVCIPPDNCVYQLVLGRMRSLCHSVPGRIPEDVHVCAWLNEMLHVDKHPGMLRPHLSCPTQYIPAAATCCVQVYLWEKRAGGKWMMAATLEPTAVLCEASNQPGQPSAAFRDKLALFKSNSLQVELLDSPHLLMSQSFDLELFSARCMQD